MCEVPNLMNSIDESGEERCTRSSLMLLNLLDSAKNNLLTTAKEHREIGGIAREISSDAIEFSVGMYDIAINEFKKQI